MFASERHKVTRNHFMKKISITDIILFPKGIFTHAEVESCVMIFEKDKSGIVQSIQIAPAVQGPDGVPV